MQFFNRQISAVEKPIRHKLNLPHFTYVVNNCRKADEIEMGLTGFTKKSLIELYPQIEDGLTGTERDIPFLVAGTQIVGNEIWYWFLATPLVHSHWIRVTREARDFIKRKKLEHKDKYHRVQVWSGHTSSIEWLNILKFQPINHYYVGDEKILIVENKI